MHQGDPARPTSPCVEICPEEPAERLAALRRVVRLAARPPGVVVLCGGAYPTRHGCRPVLRALQRVPYGTRRSRGHPGPGVRRSRPAHPAHAHARAGPDAAPLAGGPAHSTLGPMASATPAGVEPWLAQRHHSTLRLWPTDGPRAHPIERALGDVPNRSIRHHAPQRWRDVGADVAEPLRGHGPWKDKRSALDDEPPVTAVVENITAEEQAKVAA